MQWVIDRIEDGVAVLENTETGEESERPKKELPKGAKEGQVLTDDGVAGGSLRIDKEETAARSARIRERFERLKGGGVS
jgi:hypothetical protein